ncbi:hypothetical protein D3C83_51110 [compost metagenome]
MPPLPPVAVMVPSMVTPVAAWKNTVALLAIADALPLEKLFADPALPVATVMLPPLMPMLPPEENTDTVAGPLSANEPP